MAKPKTTKAKPKTAKAKETKEIKKPKEATKVKETKEITKTKEPEKVKETPKIENTLLENIKKNFLLIIISLIVLIVAIVLITNNKSTVVTFNTNGGSTIKNIVVENGKFKMPEDPVKEGFIFNGWLEDGKPFDLNKEITTNTTLEATWISVDSKIYEVTFKYDNSMEDVITKVEENKKILSPTKPIKNGYDFIGWYLGENEYDFNLPVTSNLTLLAKWKTKEAPKDFKEEKAADASCNDGYKLSGDKCIKTETIAASNGCSSGYTLNNNTCTKIEEKNTIKGCPNNKVNIDGYCYVLSSDQGITVNDAKKCNDGFKYNTAGGGSGWCEATNWSKVEQVLCFEGEFVRDTTSCHTVSTAETTPGKCRPGYKIFPNMNNTKCYSFNSISEGYCPDKTGYVHRFRFAEDSKSCAYYVKQEVNRICTDGVSTFLNRQCYKDKTEPETICEAGYTIYRETPKSVRKCIRTLTENIKLTCKSGYNLSGSNCIREVSVTPNLSCPNGFKLSGTKCYK